MRSNPYSIQDFVTRALESSGALVEQKEYALLKHARCALIPDFNGRDMLLLAFDYEVAQENKDR